MAHFEQGEQLNVGGIDLEVGGIHLEVGLYAKHKGLDAGVLIGWHNELEGSGRRRDGRF